MVASRPERSLSDVSCALSRAGRSMKVLLLGAGGMLGRDLISTAPSSIALATRDRTALDVTDASAIVTVLDAVRPDVVVNAAGYTAVDQAESARSEAFAVNATA